MSHKLHEHLTGKKVELVASPGREALRARGRQRFATKAKLDKAHATAAASRRAEAGNGRYTPRR